MNDPHMITAMFLFGAAIGMIYFGGLWMTVLLSSAMKRRAVLFAASFIARTAVALGGFYFILVLGWWLVIPGFIGFLLVRALIIGRVKAS